MKILQCILLDFGRESDFLLGDGVDGSMYIFPVKKHEIKDDFLLSN